MKLLYQLFGNIRTVKHQCNPHGCNAQIRFLMFRRPFFRFFKALGNLICQLRIALRYPRNAIHLVIYQCKCLTLVHIQTFKQSIQNIIFKNRFQHLDRIHIGMSIRFTDLHSLHDQLLQLFRHLFKVHHDPSFSTLSS